MSDTLQIRRTEKSIRIFLKLDGIEGESRDKDYTKAIDVLAWNWGAFQAEPNGTGAGSRRGSNADVQNLSFTHYFDCASTSLLKRLFDGKIIKTGILFVTKAGETSLEYLIRITMTEVSVSSVSTGGSTGGDRPTENVELSFSQVAVSYFPQLEDGSAGVEKAMGWDISANKPTI